MADTPEKLEHNARLLHTLIYPPPGVDPKTTSPPVVKRLEVNYPTVPGVRPARHRATFRLGFTNGLVVEGPLGDLLIHNPRTE